MGLDSAHEGYEYQDLLTAYFVLVELLKENDSKIKIDRKEYQGDIVDDLTISNSEGIFKKQIKYSNENSDQQLEKKYLSSDGNYHISLHSLFKSWNKHQQKDICEIRLCLSWKTHEDELTKILIPLSNKSSFEGQYTEVFKVDIDSFWKKNGEPPKGWNKFRQEKKSFKWEDFKEFCNHLVIETKFPKQSNTTEFRDGQLERIVLDLVKKLGIGYYPNDDISPINFSLNLIELIRKSRSRGLDISVKKLVSRLGVKTDFGAIEQFFPVDPDKNVVSSRILNKVISVLKEETKVHLKGEPGGGKSWLVHNLTEELKKLGYKVVRHYCYTDLKDEHLKDRILVKTFLGNIIAEILETYPELEDKKIAKYASTLIELNNLISHITEDTVLIIDGLDHIERVFDFFQAELNLEDVAILDTISKLEITPNVKLLLVSQPLGNSNVFSDFYSTYIDSWDLSEVIQLLKFRDIVDQEIGEEEKLSEFLLRKSSGNPLYVNYLTEEFRLIGSVNKLEILPDYNSDVESYYDYLFQKIDEGQSVTQILSGVNFLLSKKEIVEITGLGNKMVTKVINYLLPVLKESIATGGYIIYHESFRRYIIAKLKEDETNLSRVIYKPLLEWFEEKGIFQFQKAYKFYFQLLFDDSQYDKLLEYLDNNFVLWSIYNGFSLDAIKHNYKFLVKSAVKQKSFSKVVQANEISKVLSSTDYEYEEAYEYLSALVYLKGVEALSSILTFEGKATFPLMLGLKGCYLCSEFKHPAPWAAYIPSILEDGRISLEHYKYFIRYLLVQNSTTKLLDNATIISKNENTEFVSIFLEELDEYHDSDFIESIVNETEISQLRLSQSTLRESNINTSPFDLIQEILELDDLYGKRNLIKNYFDTVIRNKSNSSLVSSLISVVEGAKSINWFCNWIIFRTRILAYDHNVDSIVDVFRYLEKDTDIYKGKIKITSLNKIEKFINESIFEGVGLVRTSDEWEKVINILVNVSDAITYYYQKELAGPLSVDTIFEILDKCSNLDNRKYVIQAFERIIEDKKSYYLHYYLSDFNFKLSRQYSLFGNRELANERFKEGIRFLFGYTHRRDYTIEDLVNGIESYSKLFPKEGKEYLRRIYSLVNAVVEHTDGKDTKYYPLHWFEEYLKIDSSEASLFLLNQLKHPIYNWMYEKQLASLLIHTQGQVSVEIESIIFTTLTTESSEDFLSLGRDLIVKIDSDLSWLQRIIACLVYRKVKSTTDRNYSISFLKEIDSIVQSVFTRGNLPKLEVFKKKEDRYNTSKDRIRGFGDNLVERELFSKMSIEELINYFNDNVIRPIDVLGLHYWLFDKKLTEPIKDLIKVLAYRQRQLSYQDEDVDFSNAFNHDSDLSTYYWTCRFVCHFDGWFNFLTEIDAFERAYQQNQKLALDTFFEVTDEVLCEIGFKTSFSSNLLNALQRVEYPKEEIRDVWEKIYFATESRLPIKEEEDWDLLLEDSLGLDSEEILICILLCRLKSNVSERHHNVLSGIHYLFSEYPDKMIKPTKWFLKNHKLFLEINLILILEILFDYYYQDQNYIKNFKDELEDIYPQNIFIIDFILHHLLLKGLVIPQNDSLSQAESSEGVVNFFRFLNYRNEIMYKLSPKFENIVSHYIENYGELYSTNLELLHNRSLDKCVDNICPSNYFYVLLNKYLYNELLSIPNPFGYLYICYNTLVAQNNSVVLRPSTLKRPSLIHDDWLKQDIRISNWIRLASYEKELINVKYSSTYYDIEEVYQGVIFSDNVGRTYPYSDYRLYPQNIWGNSMNGELLDPFICRYLFQSQEGLEEYRILWLNPHLIEYLDLKVDSPSDGLIARNSQNEIILQLRIWVDDFESYGRDISSEVPKLKGCDLIIREDYFDKICSLFNSQPYLYLLKRST